MKILLQNAKTSRYVKTGASGWTSSPEHARNFPDGLDALAFCFAGGFVNMRMLVKYSDSRMNFACPVTDARGD